MYKAFVTGKTSFQCFDYPYFINANLNCSRNLWFRFFCVGFFHTQIPNQKACFMCYFSESFPIQKMQRKCIMLYVSDVTGHVFSVKYLHTTQTLLLYFYDQIDKSWTQTIIQVLFLLLDSNACLWNVLTVHRIANVSFSISCLRKYYSLRRITQVMQH